MKSCLFDIWTRHTGTNILTQSLTVKYPCGQCSQQFSHKGVLDKHQRSVHEGVKYPCGQCGKQFSSKEYVAEHQRSVHEGVKYHCGQCDKQLSRKENLTRHHKSLHSILFCLEITNKCFHDILFKSNAF